MRATSWFPVTRRHQRRYLSLSCAQRLHRRSRRDSPLPAWRTATEAAKFERRGVGLAPSARGKQRPLGPLELDDPLGALADAPQRRSDHRSSAAEYVCSIAASIAGREFECV